MYKKISTVFIALTSLIVTGTGMPAYSKDNSYKEKAVALPKAIGGAIAGVTIGVPVSISKGVKKMTYDMHDSISQNFSFSDESDFYSKSMATILAVPYGLVGGTIYGCIKGVEHGLISGTEKPFSKESFSLDQ